MTASRDIVVVEDDRSVDTHVLALRRKLGDAVDIANVRGVGFRLVSR
jgi:DNA-binding response OmpR family regulator